MAHKLQRLLAASALALFVAACSRDPAPPVEKAANDLLRHVPADTPYVFVTGRHLPAGLRDRLGDHYAAQLAAQRASLIRVRAQVEASEDAAPFARQARQLFDVLDALAAEFEGRSSADELRELGIEPVTRSAIYGIGLLPALRVEIADADRLNAMLDRVERRAGVSAVRAEYRGQPYRRIDLGEVDAVLSVTGQHLIGGLLADALFERHLPLLLGQTLPEASLAASGDIDALIARHGFTGYGEGFLDLKAILATLLGNGRGHNGDVMAALGIDALPASPGCISMTGQLVAGMPRMVVGVVEADERRLAARGIWESSPPVAGYLTRLAAPVPGVGAAYDGLLAVGLGIDLPQLRNAIESLLQQVIAIGGSCEWVDPAGIRAVIPQINLALGPLTAGIKGFLLQIDDLEIDPETLQPSAVRAGLLAAVDDPRGVFALGAMFNPALAALQIPADGSFVALPRDLGLDAQAPPLQVAIRDKALLILAGADSDDMARPLLDAAAASPAPLFAADYGVRRLVEKFGGLLEQSADRLLQQGQTDVALELRDQLDEFRRQAALYERLRVSVYASDQGLVMDQVMELR